MNFDFNVLVAKLKALWEKLLGFFQSKKPDPKPEPQPDPAPKPADPVPPTPPAPTPAPESKPNVIDGLLGGQPRPPVQQDAPQPLVFDWHDGFNLTGSGHPVRNTLSGGVYSFYFDLPEGKTSYEAKVGEVPGTNDGVVTIFADGQNTIPLNIRNASLSVSGVTAGKKEVKVKLEDKNSFEVVVYF